MGFVYKIVNIKTKKFYIGSTVSKPSLRKTRHFSALKHNKHHCLYLQRAYNKHGKEYFSFEVIEESEQHKKREKELIEHYGLKNIYNVSPEASGGDVLSKHPNRSKIIKKIKKSLKLKRRNLSREERKKIWGRKGKDNPNWKGGISKPKCRCGKIKTVNAKTCQSCRDRVGPNNPFFNKKHKKSTKAKLSKTNKGKPNTRDRKKIYIDGKIYESCTVAAKIFNITVAAMAYRAKSKNFPNTYYMDKNETRKII